MELMNKEQAVEILEALVTAIEILKLSDRKKGRWIDFTEMNWHVWHCSECGQEVQRKTAFCPACGALMSWDGELGWK